MEYPPIAAARVQRLLASSAVRETPPGWYLRRWHFHPDGYLSRAGVRWYDRVIRRLYNWPAESAIQDYVATVVERTGAAAVVDAGCGSGRFLAALARRRSSARLIGVDLSPVMLSRARAVIPAGAGVELCQADLATLNPAAFAEGGVDLVVLSHVLGHLPAPVAAEVASRAIGTVHESGYIAVIDHPWHSLPAPLEMLIPLKERRFRAGAIIVRVYRRPRAAAE